LRKGDFLIYIGKEHEEHPLSPDIPKIEYSERSTTVTIFSTKEKFEEEKREIELNERQTKAVEFLREDKTITRSRYESLFDCSKKTAYNDLQDLIEKGIITREGKGKNVYYEFKL